MDRILQSVPSTLSATFYSGGSIVDPGTVTVTVTRSDGTPIVTDAATGGTGEAARTYTLSVINAALLDRLTLRWVSATYGAITTTVDVVGGFLFSISDARVALSDNTYDADKIVEARTYAETELENALGYALVPRYSLGTFRWPRWPLRLKPYVRAVRSVTVDGVAYTVPELAGLSFDAAGFLYNGYSTGWYSTGAPTVVGYEHGLDSPPPGAARAALATAVEYLGGGTGSVDPRAERLITDDGTIVYGASGAGQFRGVGVNEWVAANRIPAIA